MWLSWRQSYNWRRQSGAWRIRVWWAVTSPVGLWTSDQHFHWVSPNYQNIKIPMKASLIYEPWILPPRCNTRLTKSILYFANTNIQIYLSNYIYKLELKHPKFKLLSSEVGWHLVTSLPRTQKGDKQTGISNGCNSTLSMIEFWGSLSSSLPSHHLMRELPPHLQHKKWNTDTWTG